LKILNFVWENRFILVVLVAIVLFALLEWQAFKSRAYSIMLQAKRMAKDAILKSGDEQVDWIIRRAYLWLPKSLVMFISEGKMRKIICYLYHKSKDYLDDGKINNSI
jgi:hypothetical protein